MAILCVCVCILCCSGGVRDQRNHGDRGGRWWGWGRPSRLQRAEEHRPSSSICWPSWGYVTVVCFISGLQVCLIIYCTVYSACTYSTSCPTSASKSIKSNHNSHYSWTEIEIELRLNLTVGSVSVYGTDYELHTTWYCDPAVVVAHIGNTLVSYKMTKITQSRTSVAIGWLLGQCQWNGIGNAEPLAFHLLVPPSKVWDKAV